jgi:hypothetical protein
MKLCWACSIGSEDFGQAFRSVVAEREYLYLSDATIATSIDAVVILREYRPKAYGLGEN